MSLYILIADKDSPQQDTVLFLTMSHKEAP